MSRTSKIRRAATLASGLVALGLTPAVLAQSQADRREVGKAGPPAIETRQTPLSAPVKPIALPPPKREPTLKVSLSPDGQTVYLVGMILDGSFHRFDAVMRGAPKVKRVHLSSAGGYTIEARLIAALVRKRRLDTYVEFYCASACTQVFAAGRERVIGPKAQIGFHQAVTIDPKGGTGGVRAATDRKLTSTTVFGVNGNDTLRLAYELAGIDHAFIDKALTYDHQAMWLPAAAELVTARVVTRVAKTSEVPSAPGGGVDRDAIQAKLLQSPLWRTALNRIPEPTERIIDDIWRSANSGYPLDQAIEGGRVKLILAGSRGMSRAPDDLLARGLALYTGSARSQRNRGYPGCQAEIGTVPLPSDADDRAFEQGEDQLVIDFLRSDVRVSAMDDDAATKIFAREIIPLLMKSYRTESFSKREGRCRIGFQTFEAIDGLPPKKRVRAYRALLSLPGLADAE